MKYCKDFPLIFEDKLLDVPEDKRDDAGRMLSDLRADELEQNPIKGDFDIEHLAGSIMNHIPVIHPTDHQRIKADAHICSRQI